MRRCLILVIIALIFIGLPGCTKKVVSSKAGFEEVPGEVPEGEIVPRYSPGSTPMEVALPVEETRPEERPAEVIIPPVAIVPKEVAPAPVIKGIADIFFDYDRFSIREDARPVLEVNAEYLKANKGIRILIEGHCDERGTSEYNIALGERRAQATKQYLVDLGIDPSRVSIISYGKERPFCTAHNEGCWQENRRAHFVAK